MDKKRFLSHISTQIEQLKTKGLFKEERVIVSPQKPEMVVQGGQAVLNFCANNYLGLSDHPLLVQVAQEAVEN